MDVGKWNGLGKDGVSALGVREYDDGLPRLSITEPRCGG